MLFHLYFDDGGRCEDLCDHDDRGDGDSVNIRIVGAAIHEGELCAALSRGATLCPACAKVFDEFVAEVRSTVALLSRSPLTAPLKPVRSRKVAITHGPFCDKGSVLQPPTPPAGGPWRLAGVVKLPHQSTLVAYWESEA